MELQAILLEDFEAKLTHLYDSILLGIASEIIDEWGAGVEYEIVLGHIYDNGNINYPNELIRDICRARPLIDDKGKQIIIRNLNELNIFIEEINNELEELYREYGIRLQDEYINDSGSQFGYLNDGSSINDLIKGINSHLYDKDMEGIHDIKNPGTTKRKT